MDIKEKMSPFSKEGFTAPARDKLLAIQELRAIAALLVVVDHTVTTMIGHPFPKEPTTSLAWFLGEQGVAIFFAISGFIMAYTTAGTQPSARAALNFLARRISRVVPLYWLLTALAAGLIFLSIWNRPFSPTASDLLKSLLFIPYDDGTGHMRPLLGPGWTLNYEMGFYAIFSVGLLSRRLPGKVLLPAVLLGLICAGFILGITPRYSDPENIIQFWTFPIIGMFAIGSFLGYAKHKFSNIGNNINPSIIIPVLIAINIFAFLCIDKDGPVDLAHKSLYWSIDICCVAICAFSRRSSSGFLAEIGEASYSLYLSHIFVVLILAKVWRHFDYVWGAFHLPLCIVVATSLAFIMYKFLETPLTRSITSALTSCSKRNSSEEVPI